MCENKWIPRLYSILENELSRNGLPYVPILMEDVCIFIHNFIAKHKLGETIQEMVVLLVQFIGKC